MWTIHTFAPKNASKPFSSDDLGRFCRRVRLKCTNFPAAAGSAAPLRVRREAVTLAPLPLLDAADQARVPVLDEVQEREARRREVLLRLPDDQPKIR